MIEFTKKEGKVKSARYSPLFPLFWLAPNPIQMHEFDMREMMTALNAIAIGVRAASSAIFDTQVEMVVFNGQVQEL